ncbi:DgyrCDS14127 [Dimorphilus gyrociliatus]|uniref:DgyrCDS14127 n=1 Tax=Dimorphilus gyrociliatus TaxID=2664684 RepID=A0A7I8WCP0_9ANNE|nr:DgyrCDS14127 [Dimorphilus gyrociliatus]
MNYFIPALTFLTVIVLSIHRLETTNSLECNLSNPTIINGRLYCVAKKSIPMTDSAGFCSSVKDAHATFALTFPNNLTSYQQLVTSKLLHPEKSTKVKYKKIRLPLMQIPKGSGNWIWPDCTVLNPDLADAVGWTKQENDKGDCAMIDLKEPFKWKAKDCSKKDKVFILCSQVLNSTCTYKVNYNNYEFCIINDAFRKSESKDICTNLGYNLMEMDGQVWENTYKHICTIDPKLKFALELKTESFFLGMHMKNNDVRFDSDDSLIDNNWKWKSSQPKASSNGIDCVIGSDELMIVNCSTKNYVLCVNDSRTNVISKSTTTMLINTAETSQLWEKTKLTKTATKPIVTTQVALGTQENYSSETSTIPNEITENDLWGSKSTTIDELAKTARPIDAVPKDGTTTTCTNLERSMGENLADKYKVGSVITITCPPDKVLPDGSRFRTLECLSNGRWSSRLQDCIEVRCQHGSKEYRVNDVIEKQCPDGLNLYKVKCTSLGKWSLSSWCPLSDCGIYPFFPNTKLLQLKTKAIYKCIEGHEYPDLTNEKTINCNENGWSTLKFSCQGKKQCPHIPKFKEMRLSKENTAYGNVIKASCREGYKFKDGRLSIFIKCLATKKWNDTLSDCQIIMCQDPSNVTNAIIKFPQPQYFLNYQIEYVCRNGYKFLTGFTSTTVKCLETGNWDGIPTACTMQRCTHPPDYKNTVKLFDNANQGSIVNYTCNDGYRSITANYLICSNELEWKGEYPACEKVKCDNFPIVENAKYSTNLTYYGSIVSLSCNKGYKFSHSSTDILQLKCMKTGKLNYKDVKCEKVNCKIPILDENTLLNVYRETKMFYYGDVIQINCTSGFKFPSTSSSRQLIACNENSTWTPVFYNCTGLTSF